MAIEHFDDLDAPEPNCFTCGDTKQRGKFVCPDCNRRGQNGAPKLHPEAELVHVGWADSDTADGPLGFQPLDGPTMGFRMRQALYVVTWPISEPDDEEPF